MIVIQDAARGRGRIKRLDGTLPEVSLQLVIEAQHQSRWLKRSCLKHVCASYPDYEIGGGFNPRAGIMSGRVHSWSIHDFLRRQDFAGGLYLHSKLAIVSGGF